MDSKKFALVGLAGLVLAGAATAQGFEDGSLQREGHNSSEALILAIGDASNIRVNAVEGRGHRGVVRDGSMLTDRLSDALADSQQTKILEVDGEIGMHYGFDRLNTSNNRYMMIGSCVFQMKKDGLQQGFFHTYFYTRIGAAQPGERDDSLDGASQEKRKRANKIHAIWIPEAKTKKELKRYLGYFQNRGGMHLQYYPVSSLASVLEAFGAQGVALSPDTAAPTEPQLAGTGLGPGNSDVFGLSSENNSGALAAVRFLSDLN